MCFTTSKFQALLQSSEFLTLASQVGSLDEGEGRPFRSIEVGMSRDLVRCFQFWFIIIHHVNKSILLLHHCHIVATFFLLVTRLHGFSTFPPFGPLCFPTASNLVVAARRAATTWIALTSFRLLDNLYRLKWCSHEHKRHIKIMKTMEIWGTHQILPQIWSNLRFGRCRPGRSARISLPSSIECFAGADVRSRGWLPSWVGSFQESFFAIFSRVLQALQVLQVLVYSFIIGLYWMASLVVSSIPTTPIQPHLKAEEGRN